MPLLLLLLQVLLQAGANPNIPSNFGKFPLHLAVEHNQLELVRVMAEAGVDLEAREQGAGRFGSYCCSCSC